MPHKDYLCNHPGPPLATGGTPPNRPAQVQAKKMTQRISPLRQSLVRPISSRQWRPSAFVPPRARNPLVFPCMTGSTPPRLLSGCRSCPDRHSSERSSRQDPAYPRLFVQFPVDRYSPGYWIRHTLESVPARGPTFRNTDCINSRFQLCGRNCNKSLRMPFIPPFTLT